MSRIAVVQTVSSKDVDNNLPRIEALVDEAASTGARAIFLPENFGALAADDPRKTGEAEASAEGPLRSLISRLSSKHRCWIFAGTMPSSLRPDGSEVDQQRVRAASYVYDDNGREATRYDKIHMFDVDVADSHRHYLESSTFEPGEDIVSIDSPVGHVGLTVCYDIRFPELYRELFYRGAEILAIPSAFTKPTGAAHFEILMRARAIECFSYAVAACQGGTHDSGRETWGHSMVVDPWGEIIAEAAEGEAVLTAEIDLVRLREIRRDMPVLDQRRIDRGVPRRNP